MLKIYVDADACPVKTEVYRVAKRYQLSVVLVANTRMRIPFDDQIRLVIVDDDMDAADDWIVQHVEKDDIVITADIPLADRCIKKSAWVIGTTGKRFTESSIGQVLATRNLLSELREVGEITGGPPPIKKQDRSQFLQQLDNIIQMIRRENQIQ